MALGTGRARRGSTTTEHADTAATRPVGSKASATDVTSHRRAPWSSAASVKAPENDAGASALAAMPSSGSAPTPATVVSDIASTVVNALSPLANDAPRTPVEPPTLWTLAAFARREFEQAFSNPAPTVNPVAGQITNGLVIDTPTLDGQSIDPAITGETGPTCGRVGPDCQRAAQRHRGAGHIHRSTIDRVPGLHRVFRVLGAVGDFLGVDLAIPLGQLLSSDSPPWFTTLGLNVQRSEFEGMPVWTLQSPGSTSEKTVVAIHGGAFILQPTIFHWLNYAAMASNTGATVIVPIYPLVPQGGTAGTVVPAMADLISSQIDQHGAENVSVYGDSLGGTIGLAAVQELVRRGDPVPSHMVLISPALDLTFSNPAIQFVDDPVLSASPPDSAQDCPTLGRRPRSHRSAGQSPVRVTGWASADRGLLRKPGHPRARWACPPRQGLGDAGRRLHLHPPQG